MLPFAFNTLRQAALNYQMNSNPNGCASTPTMVGGHPNQSTPPYMLPYPSLDTLLGYRAFGCPPRFIHEEPKPQHSYIGLIAMAILSSPDKKMVLSDIYQWILDNYPYFRTRGPGWRNSIRHNLSLNDCFIKSGRSANGKGHYWAIHPANGEDFRRGDFRRRRAQKKVRKYNGLSVPDDDDDSDDSPAQSPQTLAYSSPSVVGKGEAHPLVLPTSLIPPLNDSHSSSDQFSPKSSGSGEQSKEEEEKRDLSMPLKKRKLFDMASILAPERGGTQDKRAKLEGSTTGGVNERAEFANQAHFINNMTHVLNAASNTNRASYGYPNPSSQFWSAALSGFGVGGSGSLMSPWAFLPQPQLAAESSPPPPSPTNPSPPANSQLQWQETFAKIMARSYRGFPEKKVEPTAPQRNCQDNEIGDSILTNEEHLQFKQDCEIKTE